MPEKIVEVADKLDNAGTRGKGPKYTHMPMRVVSMALLLALLSGCVPIPAGYVTIWPHSCERSAAISGTLLDERTRTPVAGADVVFSEDRRLHDKSGTDGSFKIRATRYHYWTTWYGPGGKAGSWKPPLNSEITITHTNWATRKIQWDKSPQTVLLQKLPEPSEVRPWMTFDGSGVILEDGGAARYVAAKPVMAMAGRAPRPILSRSYTDGMDRSTNIPNGALLVINVPFVQKVYDPHLTMLQGPVKPPFTATTAAGFSWSFWPRYERTRSVNWTNGASCIYRLEFTR